MLRVLYVIVYLVSPGSLIQRNCFQQGQSSPKSMQSVVAQQALKASGSWWNRSQNEIPCGLQTSTHQQIHVPQTTQHQEEASRWNTVSADTDLAQSYWFWHLPLFDSVGAGDLKNKNKEERFKQPQSHCNVWRAQTKSRQEPIQHRQSAGQSGWSKTSKHMHISKLLNSTGTVRA